jgi:hypothetical protein
MAVSQIVTIPSGVTTLLVTGTGSRVLIQLTTDIYIGDSTVDYTNGIFLSSSFSFSEYIDLGTVSIGENLYAYSFSPTEVFLLYYFA